MTSQINSSAIITTFPVAGKDNDSQGFRDNFASTQAGLAVAATEITNLQTVTLKAADIATQSQPVTNDLLGSVLSNGLYKQLYGMYFNAGQTATGTSTTIIDVNNGPMQSIIVSGTSVLKFTNWNAASPLGTPYSTVRIMIKGDQQAVRSVNFSSENNGAIRPATGLTFPYTVGNTGKYEMFEAWTFDKGTNVFIRHMGQY
jgi:hypothetical protein